MAVLRSKNKALLKQLRTKAQTKERSEDPKTNPHLDESVRQWEETKHHLVKVQAQLVRAYKDLELMRNER